MLTIHTPMQIFDRPGPFSEALRLRGWQAGIVRAAAGGQTDQDLQAALLEHAGDLRYLLVDNTTVSRTLIEKAKQLRLVAMFGVGVDRIDVAAATEHGVFVTNVPGVNAVSVAELTMCFLLALAHQVPRMHLEMRAGTWRLRAGTELKGKTLGLIGLGNIARKVAAMAAAFGMKILAVSRTPRPDVAASLGLAQVDFEQALAAADYLSLHIPGTATAWRMGDRELRRMKKTACVINTARGDLLDLDALAAALEEGRLRGAGLDVFPDEPMDMRHPVMRMPQVITTPHAGGASRESMRATLDACLDSIAECAAGQCPKNAVNPQAGGSATGPGDTQVQV
jgi:D-3-phosphoglycerate dehydrogenase